MKIDEIQKNISVISSSNELAQTSRRAETEEGHGNAWEKELDSNAQVEISSKSIEFRQVAEAMEKEPSERAEKVKEIARKINEGTYSVDAGTVAGKILSDILDGM